jgi:hypothetical protein
MLCSRKSGPEIGFESVDWINLAWEGNQWPVLVNVVITKQEKLLTFLF